jgi:hypothetical protein
MTTGAHAAVALNGAFLQGARPRSAMPGGKKVVVD